MEDQAFSAALEALERTMWIEGICWIAGVVALVYIGWNTYSDKFPIHVIALTVLLGYFLFAKVIPLIDDYANRNVIVAEGTYVNTSPTNTPRASAGILQIALYTGDEELLLKTVGGDFPQSGEHHVRAYYSKKSKYLLYIELLDAG